MYLTETPSFKFKSNDKNNTQLKENVQTNNQKNELKNISEIHDKLISKISIYFVICLNKKIIQNVFFRFKQSKWRK